MLNSNDMILRNGGSPFGGGGTTSMGIDAVGTTSRNRSSLGMLQSKLDPWAMARQSQFPPPRIPPQFLPSSRMLTGGAAAAAVAAAGGQPSLGMLCDVAMGGGGLGGAGGGVDHLGSSGNKRSSLDAYSTGSSNKRFKHQLSPPFKNESNGSKPVLLKDNPVLLERISSLGGGFKWGGFGKSLFKSKAVQQKVQEPPPTRIGAFPMPSVDGRLPALLEKKPMLTSFKALWRTTELELRPEVFSRNLQRGHVKIVDPDDDTTNGQPQRRQAL